MQHKLQPKHNATIQLN